ncbi:hypothetical protein ACH0BF_13575 [Pseudobacillus sp. 179-B 2D1 NHS]|uniref:hypothetical protein n=1 Tax=Pseudobacillus sp. 179-B 2D1 NHS TaxID=3374292 RepID=UPI00387A6B74
MKQHIFYDKLEMIRELGYIFEQRDNLGKYQSEELIRNEKASATWGFEFFLLRLLQQNPLSENPRSINRLEELWNEFKREAQPSFTLEDLKRSGWIREVFNTYHLPFEIFRIVDEPTNPGSPTAFLKLLYEQPYNNERMLLIPHEKFQQIYDMHQKIYPNTPNIQQVKSELELVEEKNDLIFDIWQFRFDGVIDWILSKLWGEKSYGPHDKLERMKWWLSYKKQIGFCDLQLLHETDKASFYDAVKTLVFEESSLWSLEQEIIQLSVLMQARWKGEFSLEHDNIEFKTQDGILDYLDFFSRGEYSHAESVLYIFEELLHAGIKYAEYEDKVDFFKKALDSPFLTRCLVREKTFIPILLSNLSTLKIGIYSYMHLEQQNVTDKCLELVLQTLKESDYREAAQQIVEILLYLKRGVLTERNNRKYERFLVEFYSMLHNDKDFFERVYPLLMAELKSIYDLQQYTIESPLFWISLDIFKEKENDEDIAKFIAKAYINTFDEEKERAFFSPFLENEIRKYHWGNLLALLSTVRKNQIFMPFEIEKNIREKRMKYTVLTRYQLQFLSFLSVDVEEDLLKNRIDAYLVELLEILSHHEEINLFEDHVGIYKYYQEFTNNLFENIWKAINTFEVAQKEAYLDSLKNTSASFEYLATGVKIVTPFTEREKLIQYISRIDADRKLDDFYFTDDIQRNVEQLLQSQVPEIAMKATPLIDYCLNRGLEKKQYDLLQWAFSTLLRMYYLTNQYEKILNGEMPDVSKKEELTASKNFYIGLVYLKSDNVEEVKAASRIFRGFVKQNNFNVGYKINLLNALIREFELGGEQDVLRDEILTMANILEQEVSDTESDEYQLYMENILYFHKMAKDFEAFIKQYYSLEEQSKNRHAIGIFAVQVYIEIGNYTEATKILDQLIVLYGESTLLNQLELDIESKSNTIHKLPDTDINAPLSWGRLADALKIFKGASTNEKAKIYFSDEVATKHDLIVNEVFRAIEVMNGLAPILNYYEEEKLKQGKEDDYNNLFSEILNQSFKFYGWTCSTQSRGGYSHKVLGERDIIICSSGGEIIGIIEAMRLATLDRGNIMKHFKKTFSYDAEGARFYFLIIWGFSNQPAELFDSYCKQIRLWEDEELAIIRESIPQEEFKFVQGNYPPLAICTHHQTPFKQDITMTHIYVDVKQSSIRPDNSDLSQ